MAVGVYDPAISPDVADVSTSTVTDCSPHVVPFHSCMLYLLALVSNQYEPLATAPVGAVALWIKSARSILAGTTYACAPCPRKL